MSLGNFKNSEAFPSRNNDNTVSRLISAPTNAKKAVSKSFLTIRVEDDLAEEFKRVCAEHGITMTEAIISFIRQTVGID